MRQHGWAWCLRLLNDPEVSGAGIRMAGPGGEVLYARRLRSCVATERLRVGWLGGQARAVRVCLRGPPAAGSAFATV